MALQVFIPNECLMCHSGILLGFQDTRNNKCCVTGLLTFSEDFNAGRLCDYVESCSNGFSGNNHVSHQMSVIGLWNNQIQCDIQLDKFGILQASQNKHFIELHKCDSDLPRIYVMGNWKSESQVSSTVLFMYEASVLSKSTFCMDESFIGAGFDNQNTTRLTFLSQCVKESVQQEPDGEILSVSKLQWNNFTSANDVYCGKLLDSMKSWCMAILCIWVRCLTWIMECR